MTLEEEKRLALLAAIIKLGGSGKKSAVLDKVENLKLLNLSNRDLEVMESRNEVRWRNDLAFTRKHLVQEKYLDDKVRDDWKITERGRSYASKLVIESKAQPSGKYVNLKEVAAVIQEVPTWLNDEAAFSRETTAIEGSKVVSWAVTYERSKELRQLAVQVHGTICKGCGFSFEKVYGELGAGFIEVHHLKPLSEMGKTTVDATKDLTVLCSNCHSIVHRQRKSPLSIAELQKVIKESLENKL